MNCSLFILYGGLGSFYYLSIILYMRKIIFIFSIVLIYGFSYIGLGSIGVFSSFAKGPGVNCIGLAGCVDKELSTPSGFSGKSKTPMLFVSNVIAQLIQYVSVAAVFALMISGLMYVIF